MAAHAIMKCTCPGHASGFGPIAHGRYGHHLQQGKRNQNEAMPCLDNAIGVKDTPSLKLLVDFSVWFPRWNS